MFGFSFIFTVFVNLLTRFFVFLLSSAHFAACYESRASGFSIEVVVEH